MARVTSRVLSRVIPKAFLAGTDGNAVHNEILLALPRKECAAVFSWLELVVMRSHDVLNEMGEPIKYCCFVNTGLASILNVTSDGKSVEVGVTGTEGIFRLSPAV